MPLEALVELGAYRELVLGVAKELFRTSNPQRQRVPRGFAAGLQLRLRTVETGSAMPVLERVTPPGRLPDFEDEFTQARDVIEEAVAVELNREPLTRPPLGSPGEELGAVLELDRMPAGAEDDPGALGVVFRDTKGVHAHERMFALESSR
jgi:hypothetical protein